MPSICRAFLTYKKTDNIICICGRGGTAYTADLKSAGESLRVQIPPAAPIKKYPPITIRVGIFCLDSYGVRARTGVE